MKQCEFDNILKLAVAAAHMAAPVLAKLDVKLTPPPTGDDTLPDMQLFNAVVFREVRTFASFLVASIAPANYATYWPALTIDQETGRGGGPGDGTIDPLTLLRSLQRLMSSPQGAALLTMIKAAVGGGAPALPPVLPPAPPPAPVTPS